MAARIYLVFSLFQREFRKINPVAFEVIMVLALAHLFGFYNPNQLEDFLGVSHQAFYAHLKTWSLYHLRAMLVKFKIRQGREETRKRGLDRGIGHLSLMRPQKMSASPLPRG